MSTLWCESELNEFEEFQTSEKISLGYTCVINNQITSSETQFRKRETLESFNLEFQRSIQ